MTFSTNAQNCCIAEGGRFEPLAELQRALGALPIAAPSVSRKTFFAAVWDLPKISFRSP